MTNVTAYSYGGEGEEDEDYLYWDPAVVSSECGSPDATNTSFLRGFKLYGQGVTVTVMGVFGLVGNVFSILTIATMTKVTQSG